MLGRANTLLLSNSLLLIGVYGLLHIMCESFEFVFGGRAYGFSNKSWATIFPEN